MPLIEKSRQLYRCCPLCESTSFNLSISADCRSYPLYNSELPGFINWQQCNTCGHSFADGYFTKEATDILFSKTHDYQLFNVKDVEKFRYFYARMIDKVSSILNGKKGKWLDVGFGNGSLMTTCEEYGFEPVGIDLRQIAVDKMKQLEFEAHCMELKDFKQFNSFTVISMADILEHMPYPREALSHAHKLLIPGGVLFISCPNMDSFLWKALTKENKNPYWIEIEHYHNFGRKLLYSLLTEHGFNPLTYSISERYRIGMEIISIRE